MEIVNHEYYVSYEIAKLLKELGFDWECNYHYANSNMLCHGFCNNDPIFKVIMSAPTLSVAQRWLREVKDIYLDIDTHFNSSGVWFSYVINIFDSDAKFGIHSNCLGAGHPFNTYEEALEVGIKKALEMILEDGE